MAAPASEELRELERRLLLAAESGKSVQFSELRDELGYGHDELREMLSTLSAHGKAVQEAPGEWTGARFDPDGEAPVEAERVRVSVEEPPAVSDEPVFEGASAMLAGADVRLTRSIADALDAPALGAIVKAGLGGLPDDQPFTLEVLP